MLMVSNIEALSIPAATTMLDKLLVIIVEPQDRARTMSLIYVLMILCTSPFGWIAGQMSQVNRLLPFVLGMVLYLAGAVLTFFVSRMASARQVATIGMEPAVEEAT
jgi:hypothetical protein